MKYSKKMFAHDKVIVELNAEKDKYLNYKTSSNGDTFGKVCEYCHDNKELSSFGISKRFNIYDGRYAGNNISRHFSAQRERKHKTFS